MNKKSRLVVLATVVLVWSAWAGTVGAQDPIGGAVATLAVATANAQRWQAGQSATRQAQSALATDQAQSATAQAQSATAQAQSAAATQQASDAAATRGAVEAQATRQALQAMVTARAVEASATIQAQAATATRQALDAQATRYAQDAQATAAAYALDLQQAKEQRQAGSILLYVAVGLLVAGAGYAGLGWRRFVDRYFEVRAAPSGPPAGEGSGVIIDAAAVALPTPGRRMAGVRVINDPGLVAAAAAWFDSQEGGNDEDDND